MAVTFSQLQCGDLMNILQQIGAAAALPEILLAIMAMVLLLEGVFVTAHTPNTIRWGAIASLVAVAGLVVWKSGTGSVEAFGAASRDKLGDQIPTRATLHRVMRTDF